MTQLESPNTEPKQQVTSSRRSATTAISQAEQAMNEVNASVALLRTEADRARSVFGFGRRILVPPDEIHVVVGDGRHSWSVANDRKVFGQTEDRASRYWLNGLTQVIKLKTVSFTVAITGVSNMGVSALDNSKVSFRLWAHAVAKLNPENADIAAQRVGLDTTGLVHTITKVGTAELVAAAATMELENIIANRQKLAEIAFPKVNDILAELGYDLALLTVTQLDGEAYRQLVAQAESRISKETGIATNKEQLAELRDSQERERHESEIRANTEKKLAAERLDAQREVETATISQQEALAIRQHEMELKQIGRTKTAAETDHDTNLAKVHLAQKLGEAEENKEAELAELKADRAATLQAMQQKRQAEIKLAEAEANAARLAVEQAKQIERAAALTGAEADRLGEEESAAAQRIKEVMLLEAEAEANALQIKVDAETKMELVKAEAEATSTEMRARAAKKRAEATKAETAAHGLAEAEVDTARVQVAEQQVAVTRAEGLAEAEVAMAQAEAAAEKIRRLKEVDINAQKQLAQLYEKAPVLIDLEKLRMQLTHDEKLATIRAETSLKAFEALAPSLKVHIFGNGGQTGQIMSNVMSISHGLGVVGEEVPLVGKFLNQDGRNDNSTFSLPALTRFTPYLQQMMAEVNPRVFSSLKIKDVVERLGSVVGGQEDMVTALNNIKQDATFRVVGDLPIGPLMTMLGLKDGEETAVSDSPSPVEDLIVVHDEG
ncbi:MAG: hypothetical protein GY805_02130 [Chloroflexi bacterium]|nr:hypothetical protein [Chloroflexota bacterium]